MRNGFTTGSCAAAASKAAAYMLLSGKIKKSITIKTPKGILYTPEVLFIDRNETSVSCAILKDGGDDPDITSGSLIYSTVSFKSKGINIHGGKGVGLVTKPGLDQPVGNHAINHVPREMITNEVTEICELFDYSGGLDITITVPNGEELAKQTFNPRLGIENGISIIGTTGIVEPMSEKALKETILVELRQKKELGYKSVAISPGNYGLDFMKEKYNYDLNRSVKCSNFIGETFDMASNLCFKSILLTGNLGKLIKLSGGIMNTHSKEADSRIDLMISASLKAKESYETLNLLQDCVNTDDCLSKLSDIYAVSRIILDRCMFYANKRSSIPVEIILYSSIYGELAKSEHSDELLKEIRSYA